jgi:hypothetical protein
MSDTPETKMTIKSGDAPATPRSSHGTPVPPTVKSGEESCAGDTAQPTGFGSGGITAHKTEA